MYIKVNDSEYITLSRQRHDKTFEGTLSGLRQFLSIESPLKIMKN